MVTAWINQIWGHCSVISTAYSKGGETAILGEEVLAQQPVLRLSVTGPAGVTVDNVHRYDVWLEKSQNFPVKVVSYGADGQQLETVLMDAMIVNLHFPEHFFTP
ncbi:Uncharacterised protein [Yersinia kristensenii]|nr:Uncharacterised protein [Yersinia kristensenii]CNJ78782.1 Uncharacterised protein [Yersinia kristensenii]